jgi:hypothetical protein
VGCVKSRLQYPFAPFIGCRLGWPPGCPR